MNNCLIATTEFTNFDKLSINNLEKSIFQTIEQLELLTNSIDMNRNISWNSVLTPINQKLYDLNFLWNIINHLLQVADSKELRKSYEILQPKISSFYTELSQNLRLYKTILLIYEQQKPLLNKEQIRVLELEIRNFELNGIHLKQNIQEKIKICNVKLDNLSRQFEQNILDKIDSFYLICNLEELDGIPTEILNIYALQYNANFDNIHNKNTKYKITLQASNYLPIMQYAKNRILREKLYKEYTIRCSPLDDLKFNNTKIIQQILFLRQEKAQLLGYKNFSEFSLHTKMANDSNSVLKFLYDLASKAKDYAIQELKELKDFAFKDNINNLECWDIMFYTEKLQQNKYSYSSNELKQYFPLNQVLLGLFNLINQLFSIELKINPHISTWHKDVLVYSVTKDSKTIGFIFLDLFTRNGKQQGAWMHAAQDRYITQNQTYLPIAYIITNIAKYVTNPQKTLLTFDEVQTIFHEMGHALHHVLTEIKEFQIAGINNVEWDAVELPSQFMEYFIWNYSIIESISQHIVTNTSIPKELFNKLNDARYFQAGLQTLRQIEFALFDMILHSNNITDNLDYMTILQNIRQEIAVIIPPNYNYFPNTFSHIFAGGYAAGYYSYKWAEVLATDIFSKFAKANITEMMTLGAEFNEKILTRGGLYPMLNNFINFMGREPLVDNLIKYSFGE